MPKHLTQAVAKIIAQARDHFVGRTAVRAVVAAVFDQRDFRVLRAERMVAGLINGLIKSVATMGI